MNSKCQALLVDDTGAHHQCQNPAIFQVRTTCGEIFGLCYEHIEILQMRGMLNVKANECFPQRWPKTYEEQG